MSIRELQKLSYSKLVELAHGDEKGAAYAIMLKDGKAIHTIIHKIVHDAIREKDTWHDVYLALNKKLKTFVFIADSKLLKWVHTTTVHIAERDPRREKHYVHNDYLACKDEQDTDLNEEELLVHNELKNALIAAVNTLPPQQKAVFVKKIFEEKEYAEIAAELDLSESTVRWHYKEALAHVKLLLYKLK